MRNIFRRIGRKIIERPAPKFVIAIYLSLRWKCLVSISADIRFPAKLRLAKGVRIKRCKIVCSGEVTLKERVYIHDGVIIDALEGRIVVGVGTEINPYCVIYGAGGLDIGRGVGIAAHTVIIPANHSYSDLSTPIMSQPIEKVGVTIGNNVWVGTNSTILDGVKISDGSIVAAGAVVTHDVGIETIVAGVPARVIKKRKENSEEVKNG